MTAITLLSLSLGAGESPGGDYPISPVPFTQVQFSDAFWGPRLETNRTVTLPTDFQKCEETGRIANFARAGGLEEGPFQGIFFDDSDVFKVVEGAAYTLALEPDPELDAYLDDLIAKFAAAQEEDGYLYTHRTINGEEVNPVVGKTRWSHLRHSHELYNVGHMYEAAAAHYLATGKRNLLEIALKSADLIDQVFGFDGIRDVPGHQEIEIGLVKLYRVTGEQRYLDLAKFFLDERGQPHREVLYSEYAQDHKPVTEQSEAVGHAVRAGYLYAGMADVAALTGDASYAEASKRIWRDVVDTKLYLTGGIGAERRGEAFGEAYELPNAAAYNETCAAIANCLWNHRLFLLTGEGKYMDVYERSLYNGFLAGVSLGGDTFFYPNPLESDGMTPFNHGSAERQPWFGTSCCPTNVVRFLPGLPGAAYAVRGNTVYVCLYAQGKAQIALEGATLTLHQETRYPWDGEVFIRIEGESAHEWTLALRIPGWAQDQPVPSDLYRYADANAAGFSITMDGEPCPIVRENGFARVTRAWKAGDTVRLGLPMPVRRVVSHEKVAANQGHVALERGPLVYCVEGIGHDHPVSSLWLEDDAPLQTRFDPDLLHGIQVIEGTAQWARADGQGEAEFVEAPFQAIPYYAWCHRGQTGMAVWLARTPEAAELAPEPTIASKARAEASHCNPGDALRALHDQVEPQSSNDQSIPRFTWWDHRGTQEWAEYHFGQPETVSAVSVYWFDDTGEGECRVPSSWRLYYKAESGWEPVEGADAFPKERDAWNRVAFQPVETTGLRIVADLQRDASAGILEWKVE